MFLLVLFASWNTDAHQIMGTTGQSNQTFRDPAIMASIPYGSPGHVFQQPAPLSREASASRMSFGRPSGLAQADASFTSTISSTSPIASSIPQGTSIYNHFTGITGVSASQEPLQSKYQRSHTYAFSLRSTEPCLRSKKTSSPLMPRAVACWVADLDLGLYYFNKLLYRMRLWTHIL
jgi:hypothetical protein